MGGEPEPIRLDDLRSPRFGAEARAIMGAGAEMADLVELNPDRLMTDASTGVGGLDEFGPDGWQEPLEVLCRCLSTEAGLSRFGRVSMYTQLVQFLKNRLLIVELIRNNPAVLDQPLRAPMFIAGLPRTGTTHLHQLMSADPALRFLPYWESIEPVPAPGEALFGDGSMAPRLARCEEGIGYSELWAPEMKRMHEISTWHAHEEIHLLSIDCSSMYFDTLTLIPSWREYYRQADQTPHYRFLRSALQALQFLRGGERWILKSPQHLEQFGVLSEVFPDASYFITHRDPGAVLVSLATMLSYAARIHVDAPDPVAIGRHWADIVAQLLDAAVDDRHLLPAERSIDIAFDDFMADDLGTVARCYELAGQPLDARAVASHRGYLETHRRNRHGAVIYDPPDVGVDPDAFRVRLARYRDRFGV